jgi:hypothetical protein
VPGEFGAMHPITWAFKQGSRQKLTSTQLLVLLTLADYANRDGEAWPKRGNLIEKCRLGKSTVYKAIAELHALRLLDIGERRGGECFFLPVDSLSETETSPGVPERDESSTSETPIDGDPSEDPSGHTARVPQPLVDVVGAIRRVAAAKGVAAFDLTAVLELCERFGDRDVPHEATQFEVWYLRGNGENAEIRNLVGAWANWLRKGSTKRKHPTDRKSDSTPSAPDPYDELVEGA